MSIPVDGGPNVPPNDRLELQLSPALKLIAASLAQAAGQELGEYVANLLAEHVARGLLAREMLRLTADEQRALLHVLSSPAVSSEALDRAISEAGALWRFPDHR